MKPLFARSTLALSLLAPLAGWSQVSLSINIAPPPLPVYAQPPIPGDGYLWTPGYWSWDPATGDYDWVPGTWVLPPSAGLLWTPGYWAFDDSRYFWHRGYWGSHVGYYGGLNYGYGYGGHGYEGGRWDHGHFRYNQAVNNVPQGRVHDVYNAPVGHGRDVHDSFNGRGSGVHDRPTPNERRFEGGHHGGPTPEQVQHEQRAIATPEQRMSNNHGMPPTAATPRPSGFGEAGVEHGRGQPGGREAPGAAPGARDQARPMEAARPQGGRPEGGRPEGGQPGGRPEGGHAEGGHPQGGHQEEGQRR